LGDEYDAIVNRDKATARAGGWPFIKTAGQGFSLDGHDLPNPFDALILGAIRQNLYYPEAYSGGTNFPSCYAIAADGNEDNLAPPPALPTKEAESCALCPFNAFGSGAGKGKACRNTVKLGILAFEPGCKDYTSRRGAVLSIPPASLRDWSTYANDIAGDDGLKRALFTVVTRIEKAANARGQGFSIQVGFGAAIQDKAVLKTLLPRAAEARAILELAPATAGTGDDDAPKAGARRKVTRRSS
jgi:hypothetical protein